MSVPQVKEGEVLTVVLADGVAAPPSFREHPRIHYIDGARLTSRDVPNCFLPHSKGMILTQHLPKPFYIQLCIEMRRRGIDPIYRANTVAVQIELEKIFGRIPGLTPSFVANGATRPMPPQTAADAKKRYVAPKGAIRDLVTQNPDMKADQLMEVAKAQNLETTLNSIKQGILKYRVHAGKTSKAAPPPAKKRGATPPSKAQGDALRALDEAISGLQTTRRYLATVEAENADLKARIQKWQRLGAALSSE